MFLIPSIIFFGAKRHAFLKNLPDKNPNQSPMRYLIFIIAGVAMTVIALGFQVYGFFSGGGGGH